VVEQAWRHAVGEQGGGGARPHPDLAAPVRRRPDDRPRGDLGLVDRRHRLCLARQPGEHRLELGRVGPRELHRGDVDARVVVEQFAADRLGEAPHGVLGAAVGALQRDGPLGEGGADLHHHTTVAGDHVPQGGPGAVDHAQVGDLGNALELLGPDLRERGEHGGDGGVDPDVDRSEPLLDQGRRRVDLAGVDQVERDGQGAAARRLGLLGGGRERLLAPGEQPDGGAVAGERPRGGPPHP
jgi:hypothetical protein